MSASSSNGVRTGIFGYLKGLFRRAEAPNTIVEGDDVATELAPPMVAPPVEIGLAASAPAPVEAAPVASPRPVRETTRENVDVQSAAMGPVVAIPLQAVLNGFPNELRSRVRVQTVGDLTISISIDKVLSQLSQGQVRVPFGDIRKAAPQVFSPGVDFDRISVALPLHEVLSRVNPGLLTRRTAQRQVNIPEEIASPFSGRGEGLSLSVGNAKPVQTAAPKRAAAAPPTPARGSASSGATAKPPVAPVQPAPVARTPVASKLAMADIPEQPIPFKASAAPAARQTARQTAPVPPDSIPMPFPIPGAARAQVAPVPAPAPKAAPAATSPAGSHAVISTTLSVLSEGWPESLRLEIVQANLAPSRVALPVDAVETALKRGRVVFPWKTIRSWITPATPTMVSAHDTAELELPLKVIAPLFLARKQSGGPAQKIAVDEAIPNLFFGFPQGEPAPVTPAAPAPVAPPVAAPAAVQTSAALASAAAASNAAAAASAAASAAAAAAAATAHAPAERPVDTNFYLWDDASDTTLFHIDALKKKGASGTEFAKRYSSPNEIVSRAAELSGVVGALIALPDGLMVASRIPAELNGDTLAAFLPQIFAKVSACTKELRMGELNNVSFTVGNVPWKIFRVNAIFFAAFGRAAQPMPTAQLAALAGELDRKNK